MSECRACGIELNADNWYPSRRKGNHRICKECDRKQSQAWHKTNSKHVRDLSRLWAKANPEKKKASAIKYIRKKGAIPYNENRKCSSFLGVHVAERVLSHIFKDVVRLPTQNPGYDFICNHGKKIDVKSACLPSINPKRGTKRWQFHINHNIIADYFLCIAFDNRKDLNPLHIWMIPGSNTSYLGRASISLSTISKWDEYELDIDKVVKCCDVIR